MGPLEGCKVLELAGIGPTPMCAMLLADMGAEVLRIDRIAPSGLGVELPPHYRLLNRGRRSAAVDLKKTQGVEMVLKLTERADALIEGFRPGVAERLGIGPAECLARNPKLVYGRMTGWGQKGPLCQAAAHDLNYIALTGTLHAIGPGEKAPVPPLNLAGDFGGGALYLAFGLVCGLWEAARSGQGQVVDAAIVDGAACLMTHAFALKAAGIWNDAREGNFFDGSAPYYSAYQTADGKYVSLACLEPKFYQEFLRLAGLEKENLPDQTDRANWPELKDRLAAVFMSKTRDKWCELLEGTDACFAPVLSLEEAPKHPHNQARGNFIEVEGVLQPAPAPRFSRTRPQVRSGPCRPGQHTDQALLDWGIAASEVERLRLEKVVA